MLKKGYIIILNSNAPPHNLGKHLHHFGAVGSVRVGGRKEASSTSRISQEGGGVLPSGSVQGGAPGGDSGRGARGGRDEDKGRFN